MATIASGSVNGGLPIAQALLLVHSIDRTRFKHQPVAPQVVPRIALLGVLLLRAICVFALEHYCPHDFRL